MIGEFSSKSYEFKYNGEVQKFKAPSVSDLSEFRKNIRNGGDEVDCSIEFLIKLGIKEEVVKSLTIHQLNYLMEAIGEEKKS